MTALPDPAHRAAMYGLQNSQARWWSRFTGRENDAAVSAAHAKQLIVNRKVAGGYCTTSHQLFTTWLAD